MNLFKLYLEKPTLGDCLSKKLTKVLQKKEIFVTESYYINNLIDQISLPAFDSNREFTDVVKSYLELEFKEKGDLKSFKGIIKSSILRDQTLEL